MCKSLLKYIQKYIKIHCLNKEDSLSLIFKIDMFEEFIKHSRANVINDILPFLDHLNLDDYNNMSFNDIYIMIYNECNLYTCLGKLAKYDITVCICTFFNIKIEKVFIIGNGPKNAIKLLNIKLKTLYIQKITLNYTDIEDIKKAFKNKNYVLNLNSNDGDDFETFLCNWQKTK